MAGEPFRIGLIADTHEADEPIALTDALTRLDCDLYIHLGDVGGSREITAAVKQIKQFPDESIAGLPPDQRTAYDANLARGLPETRAYLDSVLPSSPEARRARIAESFDNYTAIIERLARLPDALCISGNTDRVLMSRNDRLQQPFRETGLPFITWPGSRVVGGQHLLILWPSLSRDQAAERGVESVTDDLIATAADHRSIAVIAHEQLFKGPSPAAYRRNALARGHRPLTIPNYEPSLSWSHLTRLLRGLPAGADIVYVHGHVHDANEVLAAGAPYLRPRTGGGLSYRIRAGKGGRGRIVPSYSVPIDQLARLTLSGAGITFTAWRPNL